VAIKVGKPDAKKADAADTGTAAEKPPTEEKPQREAKPKPPTKQERIDAILKRGPFTFKEKKKMHQFTCICGTKGQTAYVCLDKNGDEVLSGPTCLARLGVKLPSQRKGASAL
jgi:hypothetical protein